MRMVKMMVKTESEVAAERLDIVVVDVEVHLRDAGEIFEEVGLVADTQHEGATILCIGLHYRL